MTTLQTLLLFIKLIKFLFIKKPQCCHLAFRALLEELTD